MNRGTTKHIFDEPHEGIQREDGWSAPHGFLFGGMGEMSQREIAEQYLKAANQLVEDIRKQRLEDFRISMPVIFLYRHAIELAIKSATPDLWGHNMNVFSEEFTLHVSTKYNENVPSWISEILGEIANIDPKSTSFRYGEKSSKPNQPAEPLGGEHYIGLNQLELWMNRLYSALMLVNK